tara:strand:+ start:12454 stop:12684 length:231 start_codon:yes stop_codon:yes gene_type:complete
MDDKIKDFITTLNGTTFHKDYTVTQWLEERLPLLLAAQKADFKKLVEKIIDDDYFILPNQRNKDLIKRLHKAIDEL